MLSKNIFMSIALEEAALAYDAGEVPVGCVIVFQGEVIARAHNLNEAHKSVLSHAEVLAIDKASKVLGEHRLDKCDIYVTLEPCMMCSGAILEARFARLYFGAYDPEEGGVGYVEERMSKRHRRMEIYGGICQDECEKLLEQFFANLRKR